MGGSRERERERERERVCVFKNRLKSLSYKKLLGNYFGHFLLDKIEPELWKNAQLISQASFLG